MSRPGSVSNRLQLSVAIIVRDDAAGLAETLASTRALTAEPMASEIVVLDTGSHDGTQDVARRHGARLIERPWDDDFAGARNTCYEHCTGDWILWLDAGETLGPESAKFIRALLESATSGSKAFRATICVPPPSSDAQAEHIAAIRLIPRIAGLRYTGRVREQLAPSLQTAGITIVDSPIFIHRGPREHESQRKESKARRDLRLAQRELAERGNAANSLLAKGEACATLHRHAEAIDLLRLAIIAAERGSPTQLAAYGALLATLDQLEPRAGDTLQVRIAVGLEALDIFPLDAQLLLAMGGYLQAQGQIELAARSFRVAFEHGTTTPEVWHVADARSMAASCLAITLQLLGHDDEAVEVLTTALKDSRDEPRLRRRLMELHVRAGRRELALGEVAKAWPATDHAQMRAAVRGACLAASGNWIGALPHLETAYRQGCRDIMLRRSYLNALLATAQKSAALRIADAWLAAEPEHPEALRFRAMARGEQPAHLISAAAAKPPAPHSPRSAARGDTVRGDTVRVDVPTLGIHHGVPDPLLPHVAPAISHPNATT